MLSALALVSVLSVACSDDGASGDSDGSSDPRSSEPSTGSSERMGFPEGPEAITRPWQVDAPRTANRIAGVLGRAESAIRDPSLDATARRRHAWEQQSAYRALSTHPEWASTVIAAVPPEVRDAVATNVAAGQALSALGSDAPPPATLPDWMIAPPEPAAELLAYYHEAEASSGVPWAYVAAIHLVETRLGRIRGTSTAGAQGPMQFIPSTWEAYGEGDITANRDAILAAGRYLAASGGPDDMAGALYAYNPSADYVAAIEAYAQVLLADERAYEGYYHWQVYYGAADGVYLLPEGYPQRPARPIGG
jgi:hypothetical protein